MLLSICMITYNHEKYIAKAIDGIINQKTDFKFELIIGNDCSTDETKKIINEFKDNHPSIIKPINREANIGMVRNFFDVIQKASGKYIAFCEGDDYWIDNGKLQKQVDFLEEHKDYALVFTHKKTLVGESFYFQDSNNIRSGKIIEDLLINNFIFTPTVVGRAHTIKDACSSVIAYAELYKWKMLDYPMWLEISMNNKIGFIDDITTVYRILPESASQSSNQFNTYSFAKSYIDIKEFYYKEYLKKNTRVNWNFKMYFKEINFHKRKGLILDYGYIAKEEILMLIVTNPFLYMVFIFRKLQRVFNKRVLT